jgi:uncharacterized membrane protein YhaH (DUF805 family)
MNFSDAIKSGFRRYFDFGTRSCRSEYWWWVLFTGLAGFAFGFVDGVMGNAGASGYGPAGGAFALITFVPSLMLTFRRLHDLDKSAWWYLLVLVPVIGWIVLIVWFCTKGTDGANRFGEDPLQPTGEEMKDVFS